MKKIFRIAPFLIILALGIEFIPRVQAVELLSSISQEPTKVKTKTNFNGIMILPNAAEQLLYSQSMQAVEGFEPEMGVYPVTDKVQEKETIADRSDTEESLSANKSSCYARYSSNMKCGKQEKIF